MEEQKEQTELSIGKYLKSIREDKNLSIKEVSEKTCIHEKFLRLIEGDRFDDMGGVGYAKAMIVTYCRALEANEKLVLHKFNSKFKQQQIPHHRRVKRDRYKKVMIPTSAIYIILMIIVIAILSFVIYSLHKDGHLNFSLRNIINTSDKKTLNEKAKPVKSIYDNFDQESSSQKNEVGIDLNAVASDTTDRVGEILFDDDDSPLNQSE